MHSILLAFYVDGSECEKARSPYLVRNRGREWSRLIMEVNVSLCAELYTYILECHKRVAVSHISNQSFKVVLDANVWPIWLQFTSTQQYAYTALSAIFPARWSPICTDTHPFKRCFVLRVCVG